jgi:hypothetical protein
VTDEYSPYADPDIGAALSNEAQRAAERAEKFRALAAQAAAMGRQFAALATATRMNPEDFDDEMPELLQGALGKYQRDTIADHLDSAAFTMLGYAGVWDGEVERYAAAILEAKADPQ